MNMWDALHWKKKGKKDKKYKPPGLKPGEGEFPGVDIDAVHKRYETKTYPTAGVYLSDGFYKLDDLRNMVKSLESMNKALDRSMKEAK